MEPFLRLHLIVALVAERQLSTLLQTRTFLEGVKRESYLKHRGSARAQTRPAAQPPILRNTARGAQRGSRDPPGREMHATTLLATTLAAMLARGAAQQCLACLGPACSATACSEGVTRDANGDLENDKLYLGGLFASTPGDIDGGPENVEHFLLTVAMINDKTDG